MVADEGGEKPAFIVAAVVTMTAESSTAQARRSGSAKPVTVGTKERVARQDGPHLLRVVVIPLHGTPLLFFFVPEENIKASSAF